MPKGSKLKTLKTYKKVRLPHFSELRTKRPAVPTMKVSPIVREEGTSSISTFPPARSQSPKEESMSYSGILNLYIPPSQHTEVYSSDEDVSSSNHEAEEKDDSDQENQEKNSSDEATHENEINVVYDQNVSVAISDAVDPLEPEGTVTSPSGIDYVPPTDMQPDEVFDCKICIGVTFNDVMDLFYHHTEFHCEGCGEIDVEAILGNK